ELSLFHEMQAFAQKAPEVASTAIVRMATLNGARALGRSGDLGELSPNALADLIVLPFAGRPAEVADAIVHHRGPVAAVMVGGQWAVQPAHAPE
ncbi:MAG TPA: amidohydrolase family protein, partial [Candidatus Dormibacteraeota bacterium]|nr:amidohydrolase family protein [Candidatus Dormibacteraeota bacterium]